jgi:hypothetical protein
MTETEQKPIDDLRPRLDNWRRAYRDRVVKNVSIAYAVERALALTRNKTDFSEDYTEDDGNSGMKAREVDMRDADFLNVVWQNFSAPGTEVLSIGTHGLNVRTAKLIVLLYVFGSQSSLSKAVLELRLFEFCVAWDLVAYLDRAVDRLIVHSRFLCASCYCLLDGNLLRVGDRVTCWNFVASGPANSR